MLSSFVWKCLLLASLFLRSGLGLDQGGFPLMPLDAKGARPKPALCAISNHCPVKTCENPVQKLAYFILCQHREKPFPVCVV
jgi:hypothetical protein